MKRFVIIAFVFVSCCLTGCVYDSGKYPYSSDAEIKMHLEEKYSQKVTFIDVTRTKNGVRYWEFGLEKFPNKKFETYQRKETIPIVSLGDGTLFGIAKEPFDMGVDNVGAVLLVDFYNDFKDTLSDEESSFETALGNYQMVVRVDEKEDVDTAINIVKKFNEYLDCYTDDIGINYNISCKLKKDFRNPPHDLLESSRSAGTHSVTISFSLSAAQESKEEFLKRWDEFEKKINDFLCCVFSYLPMFRTFKELPEKKNDGAMFVPSFLHRS